MLYHSFVFYGVYIIILLNVFYKSVLTCMPGYEQERAKIKQYLGLEWVENGLDKLDSKNLRPIRHSSDLNCDFQNVETCNWKNVESKEELDSMDFFLFTKTDHLEFPYLRVAPGPSKLSEGDNLLFVGDRKREKQTAIIRSSLIPCQKNIGKLTLDYWTYNGARVEVLMYEKLSDGSMKGIPEKLYLDCGTVYLNTECFVNIPERNTPFYLAIRGYDIENVEGSFVMIDNIKYDAELCKVALDLGEDFEGNDLITSANGDYITTPSDLSCSEWNKKCRWRNSINGNGIWKMAKKSPNENNLYNITGTFYRPIKNFVYLYIEQYSKGPFVMLVSDPIQCQSNEKSFIQFRTWASKNVSLSVCAFTLAKEELECNEIMLSQTPAPIKYHFLPKKNFMYGIRINNVDPNVDNFIAIDDINYSATLCDDAKNAYDYGNDFYVTELLSSIINRPLHTTRDLNCNFIKRGLDCVWGNDDYNDNIPWQIGLGNINIHKFKSLTGTNILPDGEFGIANFTKPGTAILLSEIIKCTKEDSSLTFKYWQTGNVILKVCLIDGRKMTIIDCQPVTFNQPGPIIIDIPQISSPFRLSFHGESLNEGTIIIDDINMEGTICSSTSTTKFSKPSRALAALTQTFSKKIVEVPDPNVCRLLSCDFNQNSTCLFTSERLPSSKSEFILSNKAMWAVLTKENHIAMIASPIFSLNTQGRFHFDYNIYEGNIDVFICYDSIKRSFDTCFKVSSTIKKNKDNIKHGMDNNWKHEYVDILPSDIRIYIVVKFSEEGLYHRARIAIDNLILKDVENNDIC